MTSPLAVLVLVTALTATACAPAPPLRLTVGDGPPRPALRFRVDTFAFPNDPRILMRGKPDLYANWCIVMGKAVIQFQRFARFAPEAPRVAPADYSELVRRVTARAPWEDPLPPGKRIVIPGFASLFDLSRAEERAVKAGLGGRWWSMVHPTNWRMFFMASPTEQQRTALETVADLRAGHPVVFFISDWPRVELNHGVVAIDFRVVGPDIIDFVLYDPSDPYATGTMRFDSAQGGFRPAPLYASDVPFFRAYRIHTSIVY